MIHVFERKNKWELENKRERRMEKGVGRERERRNKRKIYWLIFKCPQL